MTDEDGRNKAIEVRFRISRRSIVALCACIAMAGIAFLAWLVSQRVQARTGSTITNMHLIQLAAEDYGILHDGVYARDFREVITMLPGRQRLVNAFTGERTEPQGVQAPERAPLSAPAGSIWYVATADSTGTMTRYRIVGFGPHGKLASELGSGQ